MIDHSEARMLASARSDGELVEARFAELDAHLESCEACRAFGSALPGLSALAAALPREHAPRDLAIRVRAGLVTPERRRFRAPGWRLAPALAAALVVALVAVMVGTVPVVRVPRAAAADALARIGSLFIEREVTSFDEEGKPESVTRESIWFKAPGLVRREAVTNGERSLQIERPGLRYREDATGRFLDTGLLPSTTPLPEPLTPTIALIGTDTGPGPEVLGRPTRRIELAIENQRRVAFVDAQDFAVVGVTESVVLGKVVLGKETFGGQRVETRKRTLALRYNPALADDLFRIPGGAAVVDHGAEPRPLGTLTAPPAGRLEGLTLISAAAARDRESILYAKGALQVLVEIDGPTTLPFPSITRSTVVGSRAAELVLPLFGLPEIRFQIDGHRIAIRAPFPTDELRELALRMYPALGE